MVAPDSAAASFGAYDTRTTSLTTSCTRNICLSPAGNTVVDQAFCIASLGLHVPASSVGSLFSSVAEPGLGACRYPEYGVAQATALGVTLNFQGVKDYARPAWPGQEHPQQYHLDFRVDDLEKATEHAGELGATQAANSPTRNCGG